MTVLSIIMQLSQLPTSKIQRKRYAIKKIIACT